jgi:hypothetical protein
MVNQFTTDEGSSGLVGLDAAFKQSVRVCAINGSGTRWNLWIFSLFPEGSGAAFPLAPLARGERCVRVDHDDTVCLITLISVM